MEQYWSNTLIWTYEQNTLKNFCFGNGDSYKNVIFKAITKLLPVQFMHDFVHDDYIHAAISGKSLPDTDN